MGRKEGKRGMGRKEGKRGMGREKRGAGTGREEEVFRYFGNLKSTVFINFYHVNNLEFDRIFIEPPHC